MKRNLLLAILLLVSSLLGACTPTITIPYWRPAEVNLRTIKNIAIGGIYGPVEEVMQIESNLSEAIFQNGRYQLIDRSKTSQILAEISFQNSGLVDDSQASKLGKLAGVGAMIFVNIPVYSWDQRVDTSTWKDDQGTVHTRFTRVVWANMEVSFQVIDCETGKILALKTLRDRSQESWWSDDRPVRDANPSDIQQLFSRSRTQIVDSFMKTIAPYQDRVSVALYKDKTLPELEVGIRYIKAGNWEEGIKSFEAALSKNPNSDKAHYNLGVAYTYTWQFDRALPALQKAYAIKPAGTYQRAIGECQRLYDERKKLESQAPTN
jgi:tetratricopeptide (TPR) repeat protein